MYSTDWETSTRQYSVIHEKNISIPVSAGFTLDCEIFRPSESGQFPVILGVHAYRQADQLVSEYLHPEAMSLTRGHIEMGDPNFYVRRGYVHVVANIRGTGKSGGTFEYVSPAAIQDICDAIDWLSQQPWSNGNVGMFGASFFSVVAKLVAAQNPPALKAIFAPFAVTDIYRDRHCHGGIMAWRFLQHWVAKFDNPRIENQLLDAMGDKAYDEAIDRALDDEEICSVPFLVEVLNNARSGRNPFIASFIINQFDCDLFKEMSVDPQAETDVAGYFGGCWGMYGLHLPGDVRSWADWSGPKRLTIGPAAYLDRPIYQYAYESLRWFDHWLKDSPVGWEEEAPVNVFIEGSGEWKSGDVWPFPETRWTPFYLHENGLLSEHEFWPAETATAFEDSPYKRGEVQFTSPPVREHTEICGPIALNLWASTTDTECLWFVSLFHISVDGERKRLTRGWLRGSQRKRDAEKSKPWQPYHTHDSREYLEPGRAYEFNIEIRPYGILLKEGERISLTIKCADDETPETALHAVGVGHLARSSASRVTILHDADHPSHLLLPITRGNRIGTYMSGGQLPPLPA